MIDIIGNIIFYVVYFPCILIIAWVCRDIFAFMSVMVGWWIFCQSNELSTGAWIGYFIVALPLAFIACAVADNPKRVGIEIKKVWKDARNKTMDR